MSENENLDRSARINRRKFIVGTGTGIAAGLAGCSGDQNSGNGGGDGNGQTDKPKSIQKGGKPVLGMATAPNNLNPLASSTAYAWTILDNVYTWGTIQHPETYKPVPWGMKDWKVRPENAGTDKWTVKANLREGLTFSDGKPVTAEDVKFTVNYIQEQKPAGTVSASQFSSVKEVKTEGKHTVLYYLKEKDRAWLTNIVGNVILPKHIWKNVSDYSKYTPRKEGGPIGSGPFKLKNYKWESWFELVPRKDSAIPWNGLKHTDWLHEKGPFIDALRIEIFGSQTALNQALLDGKIDQTYGTVKVEKASKATNKNHLTVLKSKDDGWEHNSYNVRRVPLDDPAFRQLLNKLFDKKWVVENLYRGLAAEHGDYATPSAYNDWRPPTPDKIKNGSYKGISIPDTTFPGKRGKFKLSSSGVKKARQFLLNNDRAKHDYSIGPAKSDKVKSPDNKAIYVNGKPLGKAHTDNNGNPGQGPLQMSMNPPSKSPKKAQLENQWINALRTVGIPVTKQVQSFNSQLPKVYANEKFDMFEMGWTGITWVNDHYRQFYSSAGADMKGNKKSQKFNPMGYTNADDLIFKQAGMMTIDERKPIVKKALARIYSDAPTLINFYTRVLQPVTTKFDGRIQSVGGVTNAQTWLNIHKSTGK